MFFGEKDTDMLALMLHLMDFTFVMGAMVQLDRLRAVYLGKS